MHTLRWLFGQSTIPALPPGVEHASNETTTDNTKPSVNDASERPEPSYERSDAGADQHRLFTNGSVPPDTPRGKPIHEHDCNIHDSGYHSASPASRQLREGRRYDEVTPSKSQKHASSMRLLGSDHSSSDNCQISLINLDDYQQYQASDQGLEAGTVLRLQTTKGHKPKLLTHDHESSPTDCDSETSCSGSATTNDKKELLPRLLGFDDQDPSPTTNHSQLTAVLPQQQSTQQDNYIQDRSRDQNLKVLLESFSHPQASYTSISFRSHLLKTAFIPLRAPCLQCVLKQLPCSLTLPQCSRCVRSGHGPCLVQRKLRADERWELGVWEAPNEDANGEGEVGYTVLVRLLTDTDEVWEAKRALEEEMMGYLGEVVDRRNWVLPVNYGVKARSVKAKGMEVWEELARWKKVEVQCERGRGLIVGGDNGGNEKGWESGLRLPVGGFGE